MKIALTTIGSRGDIQPSIALGVELQSRGYAVAILTHPWAKQIVNFYNLRHIPVGDNIDIHYHAKQFVENSSNNLKGFKFALNFIVDRLRNCHQDFLSALSDFDLVIGHGIVGETEANILQKPFIPVSIAPMGLKKEYWKSKNLAKELGLFLSDKLMEAIFGKPYKQFRKDSNAPSLREMKTFPYLALVPMPTFLQKPNPYWKKTTEITGYLIAESPDAYSPSNELLDFIKNGEKPILITFGSMYHNKEKTSDTYKSVCYAVLKSSSKAILIMPDVNENEVSTPDNIFLAQQIPYGWLLNHVELVIHHFGFGTTAEVLKAGLPSIPLPHIFDQKIRAAKMYKLGYACKPLNIEKINGKILSDRIIDVKNNRKLKARCSDAGAKISSHHGTRRAAELINTYIKNNCL